MKLATVDYTDISKGSLDEGSFTVNASATMFYVTMSGIAKDKVAYPVREVCTNAWDASRGEFEVHLPTWVDMTFRVRDFGPGLPMCRSVTFTPGCSSPPRTTTTTPSAASGWAARARSPI